MATKKTKTVTGYISGFPAETQIALKKIRLAIKKAAPKAEEMISYDMPAFQLNGKGFVYYAAYKKHIGMYPVPKGDVAFQKAIAEYKSGKSTAQFPFDKPIPVTLISKLVKFSAKEYKEKALAKLRKKTVK